MKKLLILIVIILLAPFAQAVPEADFEEIFHQEILPFYDAKLEHGEFKNAQGMYIRYVSLIKDSNKKSLVILPGRSEPMKKYAEMIYDLRNTGFNIFVMSHQGQGESQRLLSDSQKGHILKFCDYVNDLKQFMNEVVRPQSNKELYLLSHSMAGAIAAPYLAKNPGVFKKAVFISPMFEINTTPYTETVAVYYSKLLVVVGKGAEYAPGNSPYVYGPFEENPYTHSMVRYEVENFLYTTWPELTLGGATARWVNESLKATRKIDQLKITTPTLLLQAGKDAIVKLERQNTFCKTSFCKLIPFSDANHEILMEKDSIRDEAIKQIFSFFGI